MLPSLPGVTVRICLLAVACAAAAASAGAAPLARNGRIAFARQQGGNPLTVAIYVIGASGSARRRVSPVGAAGPPEWAPNGTTLAYPTENDAMLVRADGRGKPLSLGVDAETLDWSPDGKRIVAASREGPLFVKTLGGGRRRLTAGNDSLPTWSPTGNLIAFVRSNQDGRPGRFYVIRPIGGKARPLAPWGVEGRPSWSPNGRKLLFSAAGRVRIMDVYTRRTRRVTNGRSPVWSPNGRWIAFVGNSDLKRGIGIYAIHPDGTGLRRLTHDDWGEGSLTWSPSGRQLAFVGPRTDVYVIHLAARRTRRISRTRCGEYANWLTWSPRSRQLAFGSTPYGRDTEIFTSGPMGRHVKQLTDNCNISEGGPAWSPDGEQLAFDRSVGVDNSHVYVMGKDGSTVRRVTSGQTDEGSPSWSPDGDRLVFARSIPYPNLPDSELFVIRPDGTGERQLTDRNGRSYEPAWSPQGDKIAFAGDRGGELLPEIYVMNADGSGIVQLTPSNPSYTGAIDPAWSPDGTRIAFARDYDIWTMRADGTDQVPLHVGSGYLEARSPTWSPDGAKIAYSADVDAGRGSQFALFVVAATGGTPHLLLFEQQDNLQPDWQRLP